MMTARHVERPHRQYDSDTCWHIPASLWSGADFRDDTIIVEHSGGYWAAWVERDQCVHRDLEDAEIASIRSEIDLLEV